MQGRLGVLAVQGRGGEAQYCSGEGGGGLQTLQCWGDGSQGRSLLPCPALFYTALHCPALFYTTALHCSTLPYTVLHCSIKAALHFHKLHFTTLNRPTLTLH